MRRAARRVAGNRSGGSREVGSVAGGGRQQEGQAAGGERRVEGYNGGEVVAGGEKSVGQRVESGGRRRAGSSAGRRGRVVRRVEGGSEPETSSVVQNSIAISRVPASLTSLSA